MARDGALRCAAESLARGESLMATASRVRRWLLVEQPGPWGREALTESRLDHSVAQTLRSHARRANARVVLIRRPGWSDSDRRRAYLVRSDRQHRWIAQIDASDSDALVHLDLNVLHDDEPPADLPAGPSSVRLVCTNGKHDPCCADFGRPVVRALNEVNVDEVWESSHVGGDRFAANLVFLPTGVYYGRVPPERAAQLVADHDRGLLDLDHYRGRSWYQALTQAAEIFVRRELDERRIDALRVVSSRVVDERSSIVTIERADDTARAEHVEAHVVRFPGEAEHLTCGDHGTSRPWQYRLVELRRHSQDPPRE